MTSQCVSCGGERGRASGHFTEDCFESMKRHGILMPSCFNEYPEKARIEYLEGAINLFQEMKKMERARK